MTFMTHSTGHGPGYQAAAATCLLSMVAIRHPALADYLTVAADMLAWHADTLPDPRELARYAWLLVVARWRSRRRSSR